MDGAYLSLFSGFVGALIGSVSSIATMVVQGQYQNKRERIKLASEEFSLAQIRLQTAVKGFRL